MKITDVKTILLTGPCTKDPFLSEARKLRSAAFILIETDAGLTAIGETYAGYFIPEAVPEIVNFFKPVLIGNNVDDIPELWRRMYYCGNFWCRVGLGATVLAGIEAALWDLKGKVLNLPVYKMLGDNWQNFRIQIAMNTKHTQNFPVMQPVVPVITPSINWPKKLSFMLHWDFEVLNWEQVDIGKTKDLKY